MAHIIPDPIDSMPLQGDLICTRVSIRRRSLIATAEARANWGRLALRMIAPASVAGIEWQRDRRSFVTALEANADPSRRFVYSRAITAYALRTAQRFIVRVLEDHVQVELHATLIAERCIDAHNRLTRVKSQRATEDKSSLKKAVKRRFRRGELTQLEYQGLRRVLRDREHDGRFACDNAIRRIRANIAHDLLPHPLRLADALIHLNNPAIACQLSDVQRNEIARIRQQQEQIS